MEEEEVDVSTKKKQTTKSMPHCSTRQRKRDLEIVETEGEKERARERERCLECVLVTMKQVFLALFIGNIFDFKLDCIGFNYLAAFLDGVALYFTSAHFIGNLKP